MAFSIVRFTAEDDAPGIVASNWISEDRNNCLYPNVSTEEKKNKLLLARENPEKNWLQCPIKFIKEFSTYEAARNKLTEAEHTSNIDSDDITRPRRRRRRKIQFPGETSSSEDELFINKKKDRPRSQSLCIKETNTSGLPLPPVPPCLNDSSGAESVSLLSPISKQPDISNQGSVSEIQRMKINQATMWSAITELTHIARKNSLKLDEILTKIDKLTSNRELESSTDMELLSSLPVGIKDFENLNQKIIESASVRKNLVHILITAGGRDAKAMVASMLRKLITDDVGEQYSLTGRTQKDGLPKESLEKTAIYKLIIHACSRVHPQSNENVMREAISDWLMQSKFRKSRRERKTRPDEDNSLDLTSL